MIGRGLNSLLSVDTGYIITEGCSHPITSPERLLCPQRLCKGSYQAINHGQNSAVAVTWLLMHVFTYSFHQTRAGSVQGSRSLLFYASPLLSVAQPSTLFLTFSVFPFHPAIIKGNIHTLSYLWTKCQGQHLHTQAILLLQ